MVQWQLAPSIIGRLSLVVLFSVGRGKPLSQHRSKLNNI